MIGTSLAAPRGGGDGAVGAGTSFRWVRRCDWEFSDENTNVGRDGGAGDAAGEAEPGVKKQLFPGLLCGPGRPGGSGDAVMDKALDTLRRVGDGVLQKHELAFQGMLRKLQIQREEDLRAVCEVAAHMFSDGVTNWGRVVTLISFGAFVAKHLKSIGQERSIGALAAILTDALVSSKREWLTSQGGWEGFVDFFRVEDLEGSVRNVLMAFAGVAGLGASLAYMIR
ncbi:myeloid cell leukemia 1 [Columba livia]|uniref:Myeloid cell leukemia 1 n=1 Tax=Columba livia TaxID=8932 RepID=A0A2I0LM62_COLLI|nr:induced myeloid leukemia cell differentiation protein Mcl-1 [Columba livia]PKK18514.1 myeloid cell leukemia 1 [Columba livia]